VNLLSAFKEFGRIYGFCPCCNEPFRLSDANLFTRFAPPRTPFDKLDDARSRVQRLEDRFSDDEESIREEARRRGQRAAAARLRAIAPAFVTRRINPNDVKVLFDPVDYVVFRGVSDRCCKAIDFLDHPPDSTARERSQKSLARALRAGNVEWRTLRVSEDGVVRAAT
jgi:predicted Holliday junction resolvase-like endonuclease